MSAESNEQLQSKSLLDVSRQAWHTDPTNPFNWSERKKWRITLATAAVTFIVGLNATATTTPGHAIAERFRVSDNKFPNSFWPVTVWNTGAAIGSVVGLPLLENFGSRNGYLVIFPIL